MKRWSEPRRAGPGSSARDSASNPGHIDPARAWTHSHRHDARGARRACHRDDAPRGCPGDPSSKSGTLGRTIRAATESRGSHVRQCEPGTSAAPDGMGSRGGRGAANAVVNWWGLARAGRHRHRPDDRAVCVRLEHGGALDAGSRRHLCIRAAECVARNSKRGAGCRRIRVRERHRSCCTRDSTPIGRNGHDDLGIARALPGPPGFEVLYLPGLESRSTRCSLVTRASRRRVGGRRAAGRLEGLYTSSPRPGKV